MKHVRLSESDKIVSDTHFGHANIIRYCRRPYRDAKEMDEDLIRRWNRTVAPDDTVYHFGDVSFNPKRYLGRLNGKIILIQGNHDKDKYNGLFAEAHQSLSAQVGGFKCLFNHKPVGVPDPYAKGPQVGESHLLGEADKHDFVVCGHVHEKWWANGKNLNVGVDVRADLSPLSFADLVKDLKRVKAMGANRVIRPSFDPSARARCLLEILEITWSPFLHPAMEQLLELKEDTAEFLSDRAREGSVLAKQILEGGAEAQKPTENG